MENRPLSKKNYTLENKENYSLYLGGCAFLISITSAILLYREISKMKNSLIEVKQMKNQLINMDSKFEDMDEQLKKVLNIITKNQNMSPHIINFENNKKKIETDKLQKINKNVEDEVEDEVDVESISSNDIDGDSEISYESDN